MSKLQHPASTVAEREAWILDYAATCPHLCIHLLESLGDDCFVATYGGKFLDPQTRWSTAVRWARRDLDKLVDEGRLHTRITTGLRDRCYVTGTCDDPSRWREWYSKARVDAINEGTGT